MSRIQGADSEKCERAAASSSAKDVPSGWTNCPYQSCCGQRSSRILAHYRRQMSDLTLVTEWPTFRGIV